MSLMPSYPHETFHSRFSLHVFVNFMDKESFTKFHGIFDHFSRTYGVAKS